MHRQTKCCKLSRSTDRNDPQAHWNGHSCGKTRVAVVMWHTLFPPNLKVFLQTSLKRDSTRLLIQPPIWGKWGMPRCSWAAPCYSPKYWEPLWAPARVMTQFWKVPEHIVNEFHFSRVHLFLTCFKSRTVCACVCRGTAHPPRHQTLASSMHSQKYEPSLGECARC